MCTARIGALLVMQGDTLVGVFSERDLMRRIVLARAEAARTRVGDVMTKDVICVPATLALRDAMAIMTQRRVRLPARRARTAHRGRCVDRGRARWTVRDHEAEIERLHEYIAGRYPG
jgi:CBS domain-containing protein